MLHCRTWLWSKILIGNKCINYVCKWLRLQPGCLSQPEVYLVAHPPPAPTGSISPPLSPAMALTQLLSLWVIPQLLHLGAGYRHSLKSDSPCWKGRELEVDRE